MENTEQHPSESYPVNTHRKHIIILALVIALLVLLPFGILNLHIFKNMHSSHNNAQKFQLVESSPEDQDNTFSSVGQPTFVFSKSIGISENKLGTYFHISPAVPGSWHVEKNGQVVYFSSDKTQIDSLPNTFAYNTVYTITVDKQFHSSDNQTLPQDIHIAFRTKQNPAFNIQSDYKLLATTPHQPTTITFNTQTGIQTNTPSLLIGSPVAVTIQSADENQLLHYFSYKNGTFPLYEFIPEAHTNIRQIQTTLQNGKADGTFQLQLGADAFPNPGIYFVAIKNDQGSEDLFVVASNHINQVFNDSTHTYVWASQQDSGKSISNVTTQLYRVKDTPQLLDTITTNTDGLAKSTIPSTSVDFVITHIGPDIAVTFTRSYGFFGYQNMDQDTYQVFSYSDRPVYRPGDIVHYKAVIRKKQNGNYSIPSGTYYTQLLFDYTSDYLNNKYRSVTIDKNGTVTLDTQLPPMSSGPYPQITLSVKNSDGTYRQIDSLPIVIQSYRKPDMDITATALEKEYISSDGAHVTVFAKTNYGQPLSHVDFSYRVLTTDFQEVKDRTTEDIDGAVSGYYGNGDELTSGTGTFDDKGIAHITFSTRLPEKDELSQISTLEITPHIGAVPSIGKIAKLIHRGEFALFIDNLVEDTNSGISGTVSVMNHAIPRQAIGNQPLKLSLYKVVDYNTKQLLQTQNATSAADGTAAFSFPQVDPDTYEVVAQGTDTRGNTITVRQQIVIQQPQQYNPQQPQYILNLTTQKSAYKVDETANVAVSANFSLDDAVVILTNEGSGSSNILSLKKNYIGNTSWVLSLQMQDRYGQQVGVDIYTVHNGAVVGGHINIPIDKKQQQIHTTISFDRQTYKPGDTVSATITTKDDNGNPISADNSLSVIDASILQIGQLNGTIFDSFYGYTPYSIVAHYDSTTGIEKYLNGGGGGCFLEGTKILMSNGTTKNIEDVHIGDTILTRASDASQQLVADTVINTYRHAVTDYITINNSLNVTWIHRIFINNAWHEARDAKIGDTLLDEHGNFVKITSITPHIGQFVVYNITTSHYHTFFANGFYVHNDKGPSPRENFVDTAYWNPHIQTNVAGHATITFKLPDNLTTFTAQAFSNTTDQFGQATANFVVQKDFNIIPAISNFYYQGDKPVISVILQNASQNVVDTTMTLSIKELNITRTQRVHIEKNDFGTATFPLDINVPTGNLSFLIEAKDDQGNTLDSLLIKKQILPKGNINSSWMSFQGSRDISFSATYPTVDFNNVYLSIVPNIVAQLFHNNVTFTSDASTETGQNLYVYSYILAKTRDGIISPTSYDYATLKNSFRETVVSLLQNRAGDHWNVPYYSDNESLAALNLWIAEGLNQAKQVHMLDEITNTDAIVNATKKYVAAMPQQGLSDEEIARQWILSQNIQDEVYKKTPESLAIQVLHGNLFSLEQLRNSALQTANDRYIWDGNTQYSEILSALAMVQKGSQEDADKAIKGLSIDLFDDSTNTPLALLTGVMYAERSKYYIDEPSTTVSVNDQLVYASDPQQQQSEYKQTFLAKNTSNGKINLHIITTGDIPIYSTVVQIDYNNEKSSTPPNTNSTSLFNNIKHLLGLDAPQVKDQARYVDIHLARTYKDVETGHDVSQITQGHSGIITLTATNPFAKYMSSNRYQQSSRYAFLLEDAISPGFLYLNQTDDYGSSPQYQSVLKNIYGDSISSPIDYSDESVFFDGTLTQSNLALPYVVYNVSGGTYYQPKTSIVFPNLGLIAHEK